MTYRSVGLAKAATIGLGSIAAKWSQAIAALPDLADSYLESLTSQPRQPNLPIRLRLTKSIRWLYSRTTNASNAGANTSLTRGGFLSN